MKFSKIRIIVVHTLLFFQFFTKVASQDQPKREFRGVWIASVVNIDWPSRAGLSADIQREEFRRILNYHQRNGINAVIVQVRPSADAFYRSSLEPWSEWLSGVRGKPPSPEYDPLVFMIEEAHERGMEFHAWLNPYRAVFDASKFYSKPGHINLDTLKMRLRKWSKNRKNEDANGLQQADPLFLQQMGLDTSVILHKKPHWFLEYGNKIYFDPGIPEARNYIADVVKEIVRNYDVDAIHMDDYFYPYKIAGLEFPDSTSFKMYGSTYTRELKDYWRRENVDGIVSMLSQAIKSVKPWVKFGISPFGVWRNVSDDPAGSQTRAGQTNYDDLYADVLKWQRERWIDYVIPQIYWYRGFEVADYEVLARWWNDHHYGVHVYIGHGFYRIDPNSVIEAWRNPGELSAQIDVLRTLPNIQGSCFYSSKPMMANPMGVTDGIADKFYDLPALVPVMPWLPVEKLSPPATPATKCRGKRIMIEWEPVKGARYYVVYRFEGKKLTSADDPATISSICNSSATFFEDVNIKPNAKYTYGVSAVDRLYNESELSERVTVRWKDLRKKASF